MAAASTSRIPDASLREILSDPAKSTRVNRPLVVALETTSSPSTLRKNRRCERELSEKILAGYSYMTIVSVFSIPITLSLY